MAQGAPWTERWTSAIGGPAAHLRARKRDRGLRPQEYWTVTVVLEGDQPPSFEAQLVKVGSKKAQIQTAEVAHAIADQLRHAQFVVGDVKTASAGANLQPRSLPADCSRKGPIGCVSRRARP